MLAKRYYFHVIGPGVDHDDDEGVILSGDNAALRQGYLLAGFLAAYGNKYRDFFIRIADEDENEVADIPVFAN